MIDCCQLTTARPRMRAVPGGLINPSVFAACLAVPGGASAARRRGHAHRVRADHLLLLPIQRPGATKTETALCVVVVRQIRSANDSTVSCSLQYSTLLYSILLYA